MMRKQHYMTFEERLKLEALYNAARMPVATSFWAGSTR